VGMSKRAIPGNRAKATQPGGEVGVGEVCED
jgi:hypothetical protein